MSNTDPEDVTPAALQRLEEKLRRWALAMQDPLFTEGDKRVVARVLEEAAAVLASLRQRDET